MSSTSQPNVLPLVRKLESIADLSGEEKRQIEALPMTLKHCEPQEDIAREGDRPSHCCVLLQGWAGRYKMVHPGKRQISNFHLPGDMPDLQGVHLPQLDSSTVALTRATVGLIPHAVILSLSAQSQRMAALFWRDTLIDAAIAREWVSNIGQRPALQRVAHLLCETYTRIASIGLAPGVEKGVARMSWPLTQNDLADATGMSIVHVNRTLHDLRARGLIVDTRGEMVLSDWPGLQRLAGFESSYLSLKDVKRPPTQH